MKITDKLQPITNGASCVAIGFFDGLHIGHKAVINKLCKCENLKPVLISLFNNAGSVIYTEEEKSYLLQNSKLDTMFSLSEDLIKNMTAESFAHDVLNKMLNAKTVVAGENALFGSDKIDVNHFRPIGKKYGFIVETVPMECIGGIEVSSDVIKQTIQEGDFSKVSSMLGAPYLLHGTVVHGKGAGHKFGMPTANLSVAPNKLFPPHGVYGSISHFQGQNHFGMTNIGLRPSDDNIPIPTIETFLLNFDRDIYGQKVFLELLVYIRGIRKFEGGLAEVRQQIDKDIQQIHSYIEETKKNL
ncbi:riboflavin kinase [Treponema putidum]|uniref:Riboflavin biosynthesis protein n=1 Tax=Treponema putidum TaxID=221027 RepID=A0AAE9MT27_9SPIR|nr:riboflavin kinase [Treponema putidum]UTY32618.1 riboflavin biosynthesis protein RibF [Treponema putidum]